MENNYRVKFYRVDCGREKFIKEYVMNRVPNKKECVAIDEDNIYKVKSVSTIICKEEIFYEVMLQDIDFDKEWWE